MSETGRIAVIGGGIVGLACAAALQRAGHRVGVYERRAQLASEGSGRNSGVLHAGIHHPASALKTTLCVRGRALIEARCRARGLGVRRVGKLVVARDASEVPRLEAIALRAARNDAGPVLLLDAGEARALEPQVRCAAALLVESTSIVDTRALCADVEREARELGAEITPEADVQAIEARTEGLVVRTSSGAREWDRAVIAAGLGTDAVLSRSGLDVDAHGLRTRYVRGEWLALSERWRGAITRAVYPLPEAAGLGVHLTPALDGTLRAGPDAEEVAADEATRELGAPPAACGEKRARFADAVRRYLPALRDEELTPLTSGVRTKLVGDAPGFHGGGRDFVIEKGARFGAPRLVVLAGIESPGLTASLAIAEHVAALVDDR